MVIMYTTYTHMHTYILVVKSLTLKPDFLDSNPCLLLISSVTLGN